MKIAYCWASDFYDSLKQVSCQNFQPFHLLASSNALNSILWSALSCPRSACLDYPQTTSIPNPFHSDTDRRGLERCHVRRHPGLRGCQGEFLEKGGWGEGPSKGNYDKNNSLQTRNLFKSKIFVCIDRFRY